MATESVNIPGLRDLMFDAEWQLLGVRLGHVRTLRLVRESKAR